MPSKTYKKGAIKALDDFSLTLTPGVYGLLEPNGAGKSTLMNIITDNLSADNRKSSVYSKVEHAFHIIKNRFGFNKVRYCGIAKDLHKLNVLFAGANLLMYVEAKKCSVKTKG